MPTKPHTTCKHRGCPNTVPIGQRYCANHAKDGEWKRDPNRPNFRQSGYDSAWDKARIIQLRQHPLCTCGQKAVLVHHIKPINEGGELLDQDNMMSMCRDCHERLHGRKI